MRLRGGSFPKLGGPQYGPQDITSIILILGDPKMECLILGNLQEELSVASESK